MRWLYLLRGAIYPICEKQHDLAVGFYYVICEFVLTGCEIFGVDVHADCRRACEGLPFFV